MKQLQQAAARERQAPVVWWLVMAVAMGAGLVRMLAHRSTSAAVLLAVLLAAGWAAPLVAQLSLAAPRRSRRPMPAPGEGRYRDWLAQARLLARVLLYHGDHPELPPELRRNLREAREDLRDTLRAHPLREDLERVCLRIREGGLRELKRWLWRECRSRARRIRQEYERLVAEGLDEDERLVALQGAMEDAAAMASRRCMPRMLEHERLVCAHDCAWLAAQAINGGSEGAAIELAAALVVEWCDFSEPWQPARVLHRALESLRRHPAPDESAQEEAGPAAEAAPPAGEDPAPAEEGAGEAPRRRHRVRVRVRSRRSHRRHSRTHRGPGLVDILLSFGQWLRYSVRAWMLYR